jgi:hypothetical protein
MMCAWKEHEHIDFNFCDCQLRDGLNSANESYIRARCHDRLDMAGTYIMLIGEDTRWKHKYVLWEAETAIEKKCRLIGANLDKWRLVNPATCPPMFQNAGAIFVPFSPQIIAYALQDWKRPEPTVERLALLRRLGVPKARLHAGRQQGGTSAKTQSVSMEMNRARIALQPEYQEYVVQLASRKAACCYL